MKKKLFILYFIISPFIFFGQQVTETLNYTSRQGVEKSCNTSSCNYLQATGDEILYQNGTTNSSTKNARYQFNHPNFKNSSIKKIILQIQINKVLNSTNVDANMYIRMPFNSCNNFISWTGFPNYNDLYSCNKNGNIIFQDGLGTGNTAPTTYNLLIYDSSTTGFTSQTLSSADPNSNSFTIAFDPFNGGIKISSVKTIITYECIIPGIPILSANSSSASSVNISWTSVAGATSYEIYNCSTNQLVATSASTNYSINGLSSGTTYNYKIRAKNNCGSSNFSNCTSVTTTGCSSAPASTVLQSSNITDSSVNLSWQSVSDATSYEIYNCNTNQQITSSNSTSYSITGLNSGSTYNYKIRAKNSCGSSAFSSCISVTTVSNCTVAPDSPLSFSANQYTDSSISLTWQSVIGASNYEIYNCDTNQILTTVNSSSFIVNGLSSGNSYTFKVRAKNSCGVSAFTNCEAVSLYITGCLIPQTPTSLSVTNLNQDYVMLSWDSIYPYDNGIYEIIDCNTNSLLNVAYSNNIIIFVGTDQSHSYKVRSKNYCGNYSLPTNCITVSTSVNDGLGCESSILDSPVINASTYLLGTEYPRISWSPVPNALFYEIYDYNSRRYIGATFSTSYVLSDLNDVYLDYKFVVKAKNLCGVSNFSNVVSVTGGTTINTGGQCHSTYVSNHIPTAPVLNVYNDKITLDLINANFSIFDYYSVYCCETNQFLGKVSTSTPFIIPRNLINTNLPRYSFKIKGVDFCDDGSNYAQTSKYSNCSNVFRPVCSSTCLIPSYERKSTSILLYWNDNINYEYEVYDALTNQLIGISVNGVYEITNLQPSTEYQVKCRRKAFQNCSASQFTSILNLSTLGCRLDYNINNYSSLSGFWAVSNEVNISNSNVNLGNSLLVKAQNKITLLPGTVLESGSNVKLKIENCTIPYQRQSQSFNNETSTSVENVYNSENEFDENGIYTETSYNESVLQDNITNNQNFENLIFNYKFSLPEEIYEIKVYPIPTKNTLNISLDVFYIDGFLSLYSITNELIIEKQVKSSNESFDITSLPSGIYILKYNKGDLSVYNKIVKQ